LAAVVQTYYSKGHFKTVYRNEDMTQFETMSERQALRFWGWGYNSEQLAEEEVALLDTMVNALIPDGGVQVSPPKIEDFDLPVPRILVPDHFQKYVSTLPYDRIVHSYGKSYADMVRMFMRDIGHAPDWVAFPKSEDNISEIIAFAEQHNMAVIPFGGGTSVCGGIEADVGKAYAATISLDLQHFNRILEVDTQSRCALIEGGMLGPELEMGLKKYGYTLRHFPQSFRFSTLGGWIATRAGGHFATLYTHIDDFVESTRVVTPSGVMESRRLPGSGAGPSPDRMVIGSEGTLGVITQAWVRLQQRPIWKVGATITFNTMGHGVEAVRLISQAGLFPSNCRLLDEMEVQWNGLATTPCAMLVLGFESADHPVNAAMERALEIVDSNDGEYKSDEVVYSSEKEAPEKTAETGADAWRNAFIRMPYFRNKLTGHGIIADTFETAVTWDKFEALYKGVKAGIQKAIVEVTGAEGMVSCRFTHIYPDGPAPYFSFFLVGDTTGDLPQALDKWRLIKEVANDLVVSLGGTSTHHHAVGRDHRSGYEQQTSDLFRHAFAAAKAALDPEGVLNPGVLIDPRGRDVGITGVLGNSPA
jgi:alkyldihydroxyacetonephosphate synthase